MESAMLRFPIIIFLLSIVVIPATTAYGNSDLYGSWENEINKIRLDILDGFKAGRGPVLVVKTDGDVLAGSWQDTDGQMEVTYGYDSYTAEVLEGKLNLIPTYGDPEVFSRIEGLGNTAAINLKDDEGAFSSKLQEYKWLMSLSGTEAVFKSTFSTDTGVVELFKENKLEDLWSWGISSGVFKIRNEVIIEARITNKFVIGLDDDDDFVVFRSVEKSPSQVSTNVKEQREEFFNEFLTGEWETKYWGDSHIHKFRPVYGELEGEKLTIVDGRLYSDNNWEYSPSTGALKIGYTEYVGALVVNNTLALIDESGDQKFYNRLNNENKKLYTLGDVKSLPLNENNISKIKKMLSAQLQKDDNLYAFEFKDDGRIGFVHMWKSKPFTITAETFESSIIGESKTIYQVEDFVIFEDQLVFKMDSSPSRLRPKTDDEVAEDILIQEKIKVDTEDKKIFVRLLKTDGSSVEISLPVSGFDEIANIEIRRE